MITVAGMAHGVVRIDFTPSFPRALNLDSIPVLPTTRQVKPDAHGGFLVALPDNVELTAPDHERWQWICSEYRYLSFQTFSFAFSSDPGNYDYADLRGEGRGL